MTRSQQPAHRRRGLRLWVGVLAFGLALPTLPSPAAASGATEERLLSLLNGERAARGLGTLHVEATLRDGARRHADRLRSRGRLFHTAMAGAAPAGWTRLGENVASAQGAAAIHRAVMASPSHRANILDPGFDYVGIGVADGSGTSYASFTFADHPSPSIGIVAARVPGSWVSASGVVGTTGGAPFHGDLRGHRLVAPVVGLEPTPGGGGYWLVAADGGVFAFGDAPFLGSAGGSALASPVVDLVATRSGRGYWLAAADGSVLAFGDARHLGSAAGRALPSPVVRMNRTFDDRGYALYAADGSRHGFGTAHR